MQDQQSRGRPYPLAIDRVVRSVREGQYTTFPPEAVAVALSVIFAAADRAPSGRCETWTDHAFVERQVGSGKDAVRGRFDRFALRCETCGLNMMEKRWTDLP